MDTIISYVETAFDTFDERPFCTVDSLVLSTLAYTCLPDDLHEAFGWHGLRITELLRAEHFDTMFGRMWSPENLRRLLTAAVASPRFRNIWLCGYTEQLEPAQEKQFAAMTFRLGPTCAYVAFRGTDATLVGWKEDFNMAFKCPVPSQEEAVRYLDEAATRLPGEMYTGGHSKGGNLAVYSAAKCAPANRGRITRAYSHDGPGFLESVLLDADFTLVASKVEKTVPQSSVVGMLLEDQENFRVVKSRGASFGQHDPFLWEVRENALVDVDGITPGARLMDRTLHAWVAQMTEHEREQLVDTLYGIINANDHVTFEEWRADLSKTLPSIARSAAKVDKSTAGFLARMLKELTVLGMKSAPSLFREGDKERGAGADESSDQGKRK